MKLLPIACLAGAATLSTVAITDALWQGFNDGAPPPWNWDGGQGWMIAGMNLAHAIPYLLLAAVLVQVGPKVDSGGYSRWVRRLLVMTFLLFAVMILWGAITGGTAESLGVFEVGTTILFLALLLLPALFGFTLLRKPGLRVPSVLLSGSLIVVIAIIALSGVTLFAHPAYSEVMALFGIALLPFAFDSRPKLSQQRS